MLIAPDVENGQPRVLMVIKKRVLTEVLLDGEPALAIGLSEATPGKDNGAWELGSLICDKWTEAEKMAGRTPQE